MRTKEKVERRKRRHRRVRKKVAGTAERPRMAVFRSNKRLSVQFIDDEARVTIAGATSTAKNAAAAKELGLTTVPVVVVQGPDRELAKLVAVDHSLGQPLDPLGQVNLARCLHRNLGLTVSEVAILIGKTKGYTSDLIRIPELGKDALRALERGDITIGHARALLRALPPQRGHLLQLTVEESLTVEQLKAVIAGRDVISVRQLEEALFPFASVARDGDGEILLQIRFRDLKELAKSLDLMASRIRGIRHLIPES